MRISRMRSIIMGAAALSIALAGGAVAVGAPFSETQKAETYATGATASGDLITPAAAPSADSALGALKVFQRPAQSSDRPAVDAIGLEARSRGAQVSTARLVRSDANATTYALPVNDGVCLTSSTFVIQICLPSTALPTQSGDGALRGFQSSICSPYMDPKQVVLFGLIPDGVQGLQFVNNDGSAVDVPVANNFAYYSFAKGPVQPVSARWTSSSGESVKAKLPLPADASSDKCDPATSPAAALAAAKNEAAAVAIATK